MKQPFNTVKDLRNEETLQMLAELWANRVFREYISNLRNIEIQNLKKIDTGTIEGDALKLQRGNGKVEAIEKLMSVAQNCYADFEKIQIKRKVKNMPDENVVETPADVTPEEVAVVTPKEVKPEEVVTATEAVETPVEVPPVV
jgi:hypothetical protein